MTEEIKDSGQRRQFNTGSQRDRQAGKGRYDLVPPRAIEALAAVLEAGAIKYGESNWRLGQPLSVFLDSAMRHLLQFWAGRVDEMHLHAAFWNIMALIDTQERIQIGELPVELDDHPERGQAPLLLRVLRRVAFPDNFDECWEFKGGDNGNGYGIVSFRGRKVYVHRTVCEQVNGPPPTPEHVVCHTCANCRCCNPKHLHWGTSTENAAECVVRTSRVSLSKEAQAFICDSAGPARELAALFSTSPEIIREIRRQAPKETTT